MPPSSLEPIAGNPPPDPGTQPFDRLGAVHDNGFMTAKLKRTYFILLLPAACGFLLLFAAERVKGEPFAPPSYPDYLAPLIFILSVLSAVALPIFLRSLFANRMRGRQNASEAEWARFENTMLWTAMATPYLALAAHVLRIPKFHYAGTAIMALYAVYYFYPSDRRITFDRRIFRVK
jgi:hypothetical protein